VADQALGLVCPYLLLLIQEGARLAKPNFKFEKRQRDIAKKKKQDEKRQRKLEKKNLQSPDNPEPSPDEGQTPV
jgi:hypothetical protein